MFWTKSRSFFPRSTFGNPFDLVNRFIGNSGATHSATAYPAFNVWSNDDGVYLTSELPGVEMSDVELTVHGKTVAVKGSRKGRGEGERYVRRERPDGEFSRVIELPFQIDGSRVEAKLADGLLQVRLPRAESDKPRKIVVGA